MRNRLGVVSNDPSVRPSACARPGRFPDVATAMVLTTPSDAPFVVGDRRASRTRLPRLTPDAVARMARKKPSDETRTSRTRRRAESALRRLSPRYVGEALNVHESGRLPS